MRLDDVDPNLTYLGLTVLIILAVGAWHNVSLDENDVMSLGMCDMEIECQGVETGGYCLGIEKEDVSCVDPMTAPEWRRAEAECALDAQGLCNANPELSGLEWTDNPNATWNGRTCTQWAEEDENIDLLPCEQTSNDITQWN